MAVQGHPRSLISVPIESAHATSYYSSLVTLVPLPRFRDIAGYLLRTSTPLLFHPNFGGVSLGLDCSTCEDPKLIIRLINFEIVQPVRLRYINVTVRTDRQTDNLR